MYLLKLQTQARKTFKEQLFTFHHVSIKTIVLSHTEVVDNHSHSTMYLLKLHSSHKVKQCFRDSHSTMYLLKP